MMWNFLAGGLAHRCTLVLYDGSPLKDPSILWKLTDQLGITIFGTSAKYLDQLSVSFEFVVARDYMVRVFSCDDYFGPNRRDTSQENIMI
jgi:acyl-coenzyme A synthetase/AMP-(fatty) acid ligase